MCVRWFTVHISYPSVVVKQVIVFEFECFLGTSNSTYYSIVSLEFAPLGMLISWVAGLRWGGLGRGGVESSPRNPDRSRCWTSSWCGGSDKTWQRSTRRHGIWICFWVYNANWGRGTWFRRWLDVTLLEYKLGGGWRYSSTIWCSWVAAPLSPCPFTP